MPSLVPSLVPSAAASPAAMRSWTTDAVAPRQRLDYWVDAICEGFLEMSATRAAEQPFESRLDSVAWGPVSVNRVRGSAQHVYRTRSAIARANAHYLYLLCKADSAWTAAQEDTGARLLPGDLVLVDSRQRYEFHFPRCADTVSLQLHPDWLATWLPDAGSLLGRRIDGQSGWGAALGAFARQLTPEMAVAPPLPCALLVDQLGALLALAAGNAAAPASRGTRSADALRARIVEAVRARHAEPGLTASEVADGLGVSPRTLHRCLAAGASSFAQLLLGARMEVAQRLLSDPRFDRLSIAEIGRRVGLGDPSHFIRLCRTRLGSTPGRLRRRS
ncbi:helix-turn-helix domain-containing protein [Variovorax sp. J22P168]|uniref:helix-turn-helix domain-containing protein n=1 Tax=Variovorax jilinensis TaxID=3053513 RepID=UPI0025762846|nr:helix-turn-helix domain-containing protein [Variovorax sp. J22P168]MDM0013734.1 helix-turn-helix domain-containing protein [Variovorax sp. J22P168]